MLTKNEIQRVSNLKTPSFTLSWSDYEVLVRIKNVDERRFYEIEATSGNWSVRELQRQYGSSLYELYLPDKKLLQAKVKQWINEYESQVKV